jgi:predicted ferric reductase
VLCVFSIWRHTSSHELFPRLYVYIIIGLSLITFILESGSILYRNGALRYGFSRATVACSHGIVKITISLSQPIEFKYGQYINLWIPFFSVWSSHPFVVISSSSKEILNTLDLLVVPRQGLTLDLLRYAKSHKEGISTHLVIFSGPHGSTAKIGKYDSVLMIASGSGIFATLPYVRQLVRGHNSHKACTRRIHLIWELHSLGEPRFDYRHHIDES